MPSRSTTGFPAPGVLLFLCLLFFQNGFGQNPSSLLFSSLEQSETATVKSLLDNGADPNALDQDGDAALIYAAIFARLDCMELLLNKGANPNFKNLQGETALMCSVHDLDKMKLLLNHGADPNARTLAGNTALLIAAHGPDKNDIIKLLLEKGADPLVTNQKGENALIRAACFGDSNLLALLLDKGIDINAHTKSGFSALANSVNNENKQATLWLLNKMPDSDKSDSIISFSLTYAVTYDDLEVVQALLKRVKNINWTDQEGYTALMWAAYNEHARVDMIRALLAKSPKINYHNKNGDSALSIAKTKGNTAVVELLIAAGARK